MTKFYANPADLAVDTKAVDAAAANLTAAAEEAAAAAALLDTEQSNLRDLRQAIVNGSSATAEDLRSAESRVEFASLRLEGAQRLLREQKSLRLVTDLDLITTVYVALADVLPGVPLQVGLGAAPTEAPKGNKVPALFLTQDTGHKLAVDGSTGPHQEGGLTGRLHLTYYRDDDLHQPLTKDRVLTTLEAGRVSVVVRVESHPGQDRITLEIKRAIPAVPQIPHPVTTTGMTASRAGIGWLSGVVNHATTTRSGQYLFGKRLDPRDPGRYINGVYTLNASDVQSEVMAVDVVGGVRTITLKTEAMIVSTHGDLNALAAAIARYEDLPLRGATNLGRITTSVLSTRVQELEAKGKGLWVTHTLTLVSRA